MIFDKFRRFYAVQFLLFVLGAFVLLYATSVLIYVSSSYEIGLREEDPM